MVEPKANVAVIVEFGSSHGDGLVSVVGEDGKGTCSIEGETSNGTWVDVVLVEYTVDGGADAAPDVVGGLFLF